MVGNFCGPVEQDVGPALLFRAMVRGEYSSCADPGQLRQ